MLQLHRITETIKNADSTSLCKGKIKIHSNNNLLVETDNHIVITGRHWLMQRMFGLPFNLNTQQQEWLPSWFAVGSGGAAIDSPFQPIWPTDNDIELYHPIEFNAEGGDRYNEERTKKMVDGITFESTLTAKVTMTLNYTDCVNQYINEAGLFISSSVLNEPSIPVEYTMFSHVTFPTIPKSNLVELIIEWFFIF